jgi:hypothetical protein
MVAIEFGFNDNKLTLGTATVAKWTAGGWERWSAPVTVCKSADFASGWVIGVTGAYGFDAAQVLEKIMNASLVAGPLHISINRSVLRTIWENRALFVQDTTLEAMTAAVVA